MFYACIFHGNSKNNLLSYCGLVDARISGSEKDLPVLRSRQATVCLIGATMVAASVGGLCEIIHLKYYKHLKEDAYT